jgi:hypothetical protein
MSKLPEYFLILLFTECHYLPSKSSILLLRIFVSIKVLVSTNCTSFKASGFIALFGLRASLINFSKHFFIGSNHS